MTKALKVVSDFEPAGSQPDAIKNLVSGLSDGLLHQTLLGVTGSGKTYTMAKVIEETQRPAIIMAHNKTLAAQLYGEFRDFFPNNRVEYFVSYYDYYQPEAYIPQTDTFIEKDASINSEIERLRLAATDALLNRDDVIIICSVSCIYGLGSPEDYKEMVITAKVGDTIDRNNLIEKLIDIQYERNDFEVKTGNFRVRGDTIDIFPSYSNSYGIRIEFFGNEVDSIKRINPVTNSKISDLKHIMISPAKHFVMPEKKIGRALEKIEQEKIERFAREINKNNSLYNGMQQVYFVSYLAICVLLAAIVQMQKDSETWKTIVLILFAILLLFIYFQQVHALAKPNIVWQECVDEILNDARIQYNIFHCFEERFDQWIYKHEMSNQRAFNVKITTTVMFSAASLIGSAVTIAIYFIMGEEVERMGMGGGG